MGARRAFLRVVVGIGLGGLAVWLGALSSDAGPFPQLPRAGIAGMTVELKPGMAGTWGMALPRPESGSVVLEAIEPLDVSGFDVLGVRLCHVSDSGAERPATTIGSEGVEVLVYDCNLGFTRSWPPVGVTLESVKGTRLHAHEGPDAFMIIGVRRVVAPGESARIDAVRLVYRLAGRSGSVVLPWFLEAVDPGSRLSPSPWSS
jgi:hypothetical protein